MKDAVFRSNERLFREVEEVKKRIRSDIRDKCSAKDGVAPSSNKCFIVSVSYESHSHGKAAARPARRRKYLVGEGSKEKSD